MDIRLALSVATLCGTIVGVGTFGIPFVVSQVGFWPGIFYLLVLAGVLLLLYLLYGEVILRTKESARLPGFAEKYLGKKGKIIVSISTLIGISASLICYIIVGGEFLATLFNADFLICGLILWFLLSLGIVFGLKSIAKFELFMLFLFVVTLGVIFFISLPYVKTENLAGFHSENLFLPYGVILFAMSGTSAIPALREILRGREKDLKKAILIGTIIPVIFYLIFAFSVVGVSGSETSQEAIQGLITKLGRGIVLLGAVFGTMAVSTSFLTLGVYLRDVLLHDFNVKKALSAAFVCIIPLPAFLLGVEYLIPLMAFIGVILAAFEDVVLILVSKRAKIKGTRPPEYKIKVPDPVLYLLCGVFIVGLIYEIISFFKVI
jgi:tyrosine-specific transport protein